MSDIVLEDGFFEYVCKYWHDDIHGLKTVHGVVFANSYSGAVHELEKYYDIIESIKVREVEPCNVYEFEKGTVGFHITVDENGEICDG